MNLYQDPKNQFIPSIHCSCTVNFRVSSPNWLHFFCDHAYTPKIFNHFLICINLHQHTKNQLIPSVYSWDTVTFWVRKPDWPNLYFDHAQPKHFQAIFNFCEFVSACKIWGCFINLFWRNNWFKNPEIWLGQSILEYISRTRFFSNIELVQEYNKQVKKPYFWTISPILGAKKFFPKSHLCHSKLHMFLALCQNSEKSKDSIPRTDRLYLIGPFQLPPEV